MYFVETKQDQDFSKLSLDERLEVTTKRSENKKILHQFALQNKIPCCAVSSKTGEGVTELFNTIIETEWNKSQTYTFDYSLVP